ncbi:MAG: nicotinate-nucleotide adenylyltransferase [Saprospiraceae bacterium]|jgi:nicotinate-nucleotide adenylyltransferase|nr:nicotinate-nucleotide adenylyltransferase [Saprospiraceae bacterium]MBP6235421.1 nicotinate-nucleotide adenylyltransferase [Saprospiraceae bacterium]MBP6565734.1 nicotinate-nucleotide adenylyltransferase [Saprospiraceae bacterium]
MKIGLFFGSFNPVHVGHMIIANHMVQYSDLDQIWMVVSPHNPLKNKASLAKDNDRYHLVQLAIGNNTKIKASNVEFSMPLPSYTIDTLTFLNEKYPKHIFALIMGGDNLENIDKWKNYQQILDNYDIYLYKRTGHNPDKFSDYPRVKKMDVPLLDISATFIRQALHEGKSVQYLVPDAVHDYLENSVMYR